jgi:acyl-CoA thioester hydrolase
MNFFEYKLTVSEQEIDELNHAGNYHYVKWMQEAAIAHSTALGWSTQKYLELGAGWVVRSHNIVYLKPAFEGDSIIVKTWVSNMKAVTSLRHYEICNEAGEILAKAETEWAFINYEKQSPVRIPAVISENFEF